MLFFVSLAVAGPVQEAQAASTAQPPHVSVFHKESTDEPVLEVVTLGPREATATAHSPDGAYAFAVDERHMRIRMPDGACAAVDVVALFAEARTAGLDLYTPEHPPRGQLIYRALPDGQVDVRTLFTTNPDPPLFSWIADLAADDVTVEASPSEWTARSPHSSWIVGRKTGALRRLQFGDDALVLASTREATDADPLPRSADVCPSSTSPDLEQMLHGPLLLSANTEPIKALVDAWPTLESARKEDAVARQGLWWRAFFARDLPQWTAQLDGAGWREPLVAEMADVAAFRAFREGLPAAERANAVQHWKEGHFSKVAQGMITGHVEHIHGLMVQGLKESGLSGSGETVGVVLSDPMEQAALTEAEGPLQALLVPAVEAGGAALEAALGTPAPPMGSDAPQEQP